jgi:hypothetical protein
MSHQLSGWEELVAEKESTTDFRDLQKPLRGTNEDSDIKN